MYARNSHSYTHLIPALGIVREPTVWGIISSKYPGTHDIGLPTNGSHVELHRELDRECLHERGFAVPGRPRGRVTAEIGAVKQP